MACLGPEQRPRALLGGIPPAQRVLTGEEIAWLGTWVPSEGVQHLDKSYGFRCGMELVEGIKLYDVGRAGASQKATGMEREVWDSWKHTVASVIVECGTTDIPHRPRILGDCSTTSGIFHHNTTNFYFLLFSLCRSTVLYMISSKTKQEVQVATSVVAVGR